MEYLRLPEKRFAALLSVVDGKLRIYAPAGLAVGAEQTLQIVVRTGTQCTDGRETVATLVFVPQVKECGYDASPLILNQEALRCSESI